MALSLSHQIGSLAGTPIQTSLDSNSDHTSSVVNAAAVWKSPTYNLRCKITNFGTTTDVEGLSPPASPCRSPALRADLSVACQAFTTKTMEGGFTVMEEEEMMMMRKYKEGGVEIHKGKICECTASTPTTITITVLPPNTVVGG